VDLQRERDVLWAVEEALKCSALAAVVGELQELSFTASRRLQLAVERSRVTGFLHRYQPRRENTLACVSRWKVTPVASVAVGGLPGVGFPRWQVQLVRVRNGRPGSWVVEWGRDGFRIAPTPVIQRPVEVPEQAVRYG
jgi:protein ImuA